MGRTGEGPTAEVNLQITTVINQREGARPEEGVGAGGMHRVYRYIYDNLSTSIMSNHRRPLLQLEGGGITPQTRIIACTIIRERHPSYRFVYLLCFEGCSIFSTHKL